MASIENFVFLGLCETIQSSPFLFIFYHRSSLLQVNVPSRYGAEVFLTLLVSARAVLSAALSL